MMGIRDMWREARGTVLRKVERLPLKYWVSAAIVVAISSYVYREVTSDDLIIGPFAVPKRFEEAGLSSDVVADRIGNALRHIERYAREQRTDNLVQLEDYGPPIEMEIQGTKLSLKTCIDFVRVIFGIYQEHVQGDIIFPVSAEQGDHSDLREVTVTIYLARGKQRSQAFSINAPAGDMDKLANQAAEKILAHVNPSVLAEYQVENEEWDEAINTARYIVSSGAATHKERGAAYDDWAVALSEQRKYDEAIAVLREGLSINPQDAVYYDTLGLILTNARRPVEAVSMLEKAVELEPNDAAFNSNLGNALVMEGKLEEAIVKYRRAVELEPKFPAAHYNWGNVLFMQKKYDEAIAEYQKAIVLNPRSSTSYSAWGDVLVKQNKFDEAVVKYQLAIEMDPRWFPAYIGWGDALSGLGKYDEAVGKYQLAIEINPGFARSYSAWGDALKKQHRYDEAEEKFAKSRELSSSK